MIKDKRLRMLWVTNNWSSDFGGRKHASQKIINYLSQKGLSINILNFEIGKRQLSTSNSGFGNQNNFTTIFLKNNQLVLSYFASFTKDKYFDKIILSASAPINLLTLFYIRIFRLFTKTEIVLFEHTNPVWDINLSKFRLLYSLLARFLYKRFDRIVTPSNLLSHSFNKDFGMSSEKIQTIHYPIIGNNLSKMMKARISREIFNKKRGEIIITSARLDLKQKDYLTLFRSFKKIVAQKPNIYLAVLGKGPDENKIKSMANELQLTKKVFFLGFRANPYPYLYRSDVFVLSSKFEGFGIALVEALACGLPCVATDCNFGPREILKKGSCGLLVPIGDEQGLSAALIKVLDNKKLRDKLKREGFKQVQNYGEKNSLVGWYNFLLKKNEK